MQMRSPTTDAASSVICALIFLLPLLCSAANAHQSLPDSSKPKTAKTQTKEPSESRWPRTFASGADTFTIYPPQVDKWDENLIDLYCAVELKSGKESAAKYGVVWFQARTEVAKVNRLVTLDQAKISKVKFPVAQDKEAELTVLLFVVGVRIRLQSIDANNDPPKVIIASKPSLQVLIDGMPQMREVPGTKLLKVINTRSIILYEADKQIYFLAYRTGGCKPKNWMDRGSTPRNYRTI